MSLKKLNDKDFLLRIIIGINFVLNVIIYIALFSNGLFSNNSHIMILSCVGIIVSVVLFVIFILIWIAFNNNSFRTYDYQTKNLEDFQYFIIKNDENDDLLSQ